MLRPARLQPGKPRRGRATRTAQSRAAQAENGDTPIIFLEPSCYSMFAEDYRELKLPDAERVAARCFLFGEFFENFLAKEPLALRFNAKPERVIIHVHCHAKSLAEPGCHAPAARAPAGADGDAARHRLLRHGGRVRNDGIEIRTFGESRRAAHSRGQKPAFRDDRGGFGRELPPANPASGARPLASTWWKCWPRRWLERSSSEKIFQRAGKFGKLEFESGFQKSFRRTPGSRSAPATARFPSTARQASPPIPARADSTDDAARAAIRA